MQDIIVFLERLDNMANILKKLSKNEHEPYDNFGGDNMEIIEVAVANECKRLLKLNDMSEDDLEDLFQEIRG